LDSPASISILEESTIAVLGPMMGVALLGLTTGACLVQCLAWLFR
jgi:hypothetical protein